MTTEHNSVMKGAPIAKRLLEQVANEVEALKAQNWFPKLMSLRVGDDPSAELYIRNQRRKAERVGIAFEEKVFPAAITQEEMTAAISALNVDPTVTGIILQRPVPDQLSVKALQIAIHPLKDIEGIHPRNVGNIVYDELDLAPCTAVASVEMLKHTGMDLKGLEVTVVGHSVIVGKPIAFLLMAAGATVTVCHHMTRSVAVHSRRADAVFVAVGIPNFLKADMIKPGAAVIDIGINQIETPEGSTKVVGDVDFEGCREVAGWITPVPGGVGPVTVAVNMRNTVLAAQRLKAHYETQFVGVS